MPVLHMGAFAALACRMNRGLSVQGVAAGVFWERHFNLGFHLSLIFNNCKQASAVTKGPGPGVLGGSTAIGDTGRCTERAPASEVGRDHNSWNTF